MNESRNSMNNKQVAAKEPVRPRGGVPTVVDQLMYQATTFEDRMAELNSRLDSVLRVATPETTLEEKSNYEYSSSLGITLSELVTRLDRQNDILAGLIGRLDL